MDDDDDFVVIDKNLKEVKKSKGKAKPKQANTEKIEEESFTFYELIVTIKNMLVSIFYNETEFCKFKLE